MKARGASARGVAVIDDKTPDSDLDAMGQAGIRGIRLNLATGGGQRSRGGRPALSSRHRAHQEPQLAYPALHQPGDDLGAQGQFAASPVPVVFDHFGGAQAALGPEQPGFSDLLELVKSGKAYVKISAAYRSSKLGPDYSDAAPLARALIAANPDRIVWGTDWPHPDSSSVPSRKTTDVAPLFQIDDGRLLNQLAVWTPECGDPQQDPGRQSGAALRFLIDGRSCVSAAAETA